MTDPWGYLDDQPEPGTADPWGYLDLDGQVRRAAQRHGVDPGLLGAMVHQESAGDPAAVSPKGARGLLQVMPDTARGLGYRPEDMADPEKNLDAGAAYMGQMLKRYGGDRTLALAAYNAGPGAVDKHGGVPPYQETQSYVRQVQAKAGPPADPWGYLGAIPPQNRPKTAPLPPPQVLNDAPPSAASAPAWSFSPSGDLAPGLSGSLSASPDWEPTGSPLLQKRRRPDGSYETRPTPRPGQDSAVGSVPVPETGILPTIGAQFGLAGAELQAGLAGVADLPRKAMNYLATPAQLAASVPQNPFYRPVAYGDQGDPVALAPHPGVDVLNYEPVQYPGAVEDVRQAIAEKPEEARQRLAEASSTLPTPIAVAAHQQAMVLAGVADPLNWLLPGGGEERAAAHGVEDVILRQAVEPHNAEELALLARRARVMPTVPGEAPFVAPGAVADSLRPEGRILGVGEHATEQAQLQALGMRAAPEDAAALARTSLGVADSATAKLVPYKTTAEATYAQIRPVPEPSSLSTGARRLHPDEVPVDLSSLPVQRWRRADDSLTRYGGTFYSPEDSVRYARDADAPTHLTGGQIPETKTLTPQRPAAFIGRPELVARDIYKLGDEPAGMRTMFEKLRKDGHDAAVFFDPHEVAPMEVVDLGASSMPRYSPYVADAESLLPKVGRAGLEDALAGREAHPHDPWGYLGKPAELGDIIPSERTLAPEPQASDLSSSRMVPVRGADTAVTERGTRISFDYQVREAGHLVTSHDDALRPRPDFPAELQPRDRSRITSEAQVSRIEKNLDPEQLGASPQASNGAPIIGPDGVVESGNARSIALRRAYRSGGEPAAGYRSWLADNAPRFGINPAEVAGMRGPVLVRMRTTDVDRAAFAREANESAVARMSAPELAAMDAERITPGMLDSLHIGENGVNWQGNRDFVRSFVQGSNPADLGTMFDARGLLSAEGQRRMQNAVLAKAYGDPEAIAQLVEHADSNVRNVGNALLQQAPRYARLRSGVAAGSLHPLDISGDLGGALRKLSGLRDAGVKVPDYLAQGGLFGSELSPEGRGLLAMFDANSRSAAKVSDVLGRYADHVEALGHPNQAGLFGPVEAPSKLDLLTRAAGDAQGDLFHQPAPLAAAVREIPSPGAPGVHHGAPEGEPPRLLTMEDVLPPAEENLPRVSNASQKGKEALSSTDAGPANFPPVVKNQAPFSELPPGLTTGTKHAITRAERAAAGLPEVERLAARESPSWDEAKAIYNDNPESARVLAEHVRKNPRQLTDVENDVLLHDRMSLTLDYREALAKEQATLQGGDTTAAALATANRQAIEAAHTANTEALDKAGTVWGRAGQARQKLAAEDYSAINLNARYAVANGGEEAPAAVRQKLADLSSQLEAAQARAVAAEDRAQQLEAQRLIAAEQRQAGSAARSGKRAASKAQLDAEYKDLGAQLRAATHIQASLSPEQVRILAQQARNRVRAGVTNLSELVDTLHADASPYIADLEPRDVRDVIAGVGQGTTRTRSELSGNLARLKSQAKLLNKLDDVYAGQGLPAAAKRAAPSPEVAALRAKLGQVTEDLKLKPALTDQQRLGRIKSALETKIERVERGVLPAKLPAVSSPEVDVLRKTLEQRLEDEGVIVGHDSRVRMAVENAQERLKSPGLDPQTRELLKGEVDRWTAEAASPSPGRGPLTEAERLAGAKSRTAARVADLEAQIKAGEFPSRGRAPVPADEALIQARGELAGLRRQADRIIAAREAANRGWREKALDWTPGWGRFIKLSGVSTLQKLGAAAAERSLVFRPLEEFLGGALSKLPVVSKFAAEAPIEGGASLSALAKNYAGFFGRQAREESMSLLKGGEGPLDLAFGKVHDNPTTPAWMSYPGKVHGAIKAPAKVAGYQYAMEKQAQWYLARGEGEQLLNPLVQAEMKARAWEHAQRDIFMGDNGLVNAFNHALRDVPGQTKVTKAAKAAGRVLFPIVKVPTNYALELTDYAAGVPKAVARMANVISAGAKATPPGAARDIASLVHAGLQEVGPEEAGLIMRQLKKGTLGAGLIALGATGVVKGGGYYEPGKHRSPEDLQPGELSIAGMRVPHMILHHPAIEALQIGAEIHRQRTFGEGLKNAAKGVGEAVPFFGDYLKDRQDPGTWAGGVERGMTIPPDVQRLARVMDQHGQPGAGEKFLQELGWLHIDANRRKPHGGPLDRLWKEEELGLPGLRQGVR